MNITEVTSAIATNVPETRAIDMKLEVVVLPVADVDRAKGFYESIGWRLDADFATSEDFRVVQLTPPGSQAAVIFGTGVTDAVPGSVDSLILAVDDVEAARVELVAKGIDVSEVFHDAGGVFHHAGTIGRVPGPDPERKSYSSWASFSDPDGNGWLLQEITTRLPGRVAEPDVAALAELLLETAMHHHPFEQASSPHDWWPWYAAYLNARQQGSTPDEADMVADRYMKEVHDVVVSR
jgi:catechol 2,3-dioxygenase-like lactoylglutathione lyase family enzyme